MLRVRFPRIKSYQYFEKTFSWRNDENLAIAEKSYWHCKEMMRNYNDDIIYVNVGYFVWPFNYNWNNVHHEINMQDLDECPIEFAWFMRGLSSALHSKDIFWYK